MHLLLWFYLCVLTQQGEQGGEVLTILHFHMFFPEVLKKVLEKKDLQNTNFQY